MECKDRILIDITKLENSLKEIKDLNFSDKEKEIIERAKNYMDDCKYYLEKKDEISSFGCITYSHGLVDALKINHGLI
ncbi:MAG: DUF357 domain-containing protein [Methanobrevibacter sp.]|nr:DUF357 domain-containing protein [Methanobrevibacter sp.]